MATFRSRAGWLYFEFRFRGVRCQESSRLRDTSENRVEIKRRVRALDGELAAGTFDYVRWFPRGGRARLFAPPSTDGPPHFRDYVRRWLEDRAARLGVGTAYEHTRIVEGRLIPYFGDRLVSEIREDDVDALVAYLKRGSDVVVGDAPTPKRKKLSNRRVNIILQVLRSSLDRAARRGWLETNPARAVDRLREEKPEIAPLSFDEVKTLLADGLREEEHRRYFRVAFFTGLRPGEQMGLRWDDVDWQRKTISVRRSVGRHGEGPTKTRDSRRDVDMLPTVEAALKAQRGASQLRGAWIFPNSQGGRLDLVNFRERVWRPALVRAKLRARTLYQTRHTFATLMLGAGEDPGWVAKMLGHSTTEMVFRRYYKFIPNLTRRDGSAASRRLAEEGL